jgi:IS605 OrfB family transposase
MSRGLRQIAEPFVVAPPSGARVRTRLMVSDIDEVALRQVGQYLGRLASADLARRCRQGRLGAKARAVSRRDRKRAMTAVCSARWAGAITRASEDAWGLAERNLLAETRSLQARIGRIRRRLAVPASGRQGRVRGYATQAERFEKQRRFQVLQARLAETQARLAEGRVSVCRGGRRVACARHNFEVAEMDTEWRERWEAARWFMTADGEADKAWGNETIRWHPGEGWLEIKLPAALAHLANRPHGRYRPSCPVEFPYRGDEVAAQAASGAVRYDISFDPEKGRWYLDASWTFPRGDPTSLRALREHPVLAVDLNVGHLAAWILQPSGNPAGRPQTVPLSLGGLPAPTRDGRLRQAISELVRLAKADGVAAVVIENLNFDAARAQGRERSGRRPSRGRRGRLFRRAVAGIPTARFRDRLTQMAANAGLAVIAVDPAYTSQWGARHWLRPLRQQFSPEITGHHAAAVVIGRRGLGQRARRRERCDSTRPEDRQQRATDSAVQPAPALPGLAEQRTRKPGDRKARGQPPAWCKTRPANRHPQGDQATQDRSGAPTGQASFLLSV